MGAFDDLIPGAAPAAGGGAFDDLLPQWKPTVAQRAAEHFKEGIRNESVGRVINLETSGEAEFNEANTLDKYIAYSQERGSGVALPHPDMGISQMPSAVGVPVDRLIQRRDQLRAAAEAKRAKFLEEEKAARARFESMRGVGEEEGIGGKILHGGAAVVGQLGAGALAPENYIGAGAGRGMGIVGKAVVGAAPAAATSAAADVVTQTNEVDLGLRDKVNPAQTAVSAAVGGAVGGVANAAPAVPAWLRGLFRADEPVPAPVVRDPAAEQAFAAEFEQYRPVLEANGIKSPADPRASVAIERIKALEARQAAESADVPPVRADEPAPTARPEEAATPVRPEQDVAATYRADQEIAARVPEQPEVPPARAAGRPEPDAVAQDRARFGVDDAAAVPRQEATPAEPVARAPVGEADAARLETARAQIQRIRESPTYRELADAAEQKRITEEQRRQLQGMESQAERLDRTVREIEARIGRPRAPDVEPPKSKAPEIQAEPAPRAEPPEVGRLQDSPLPRVEASPQRGGSSGEPVAPAAAREVERFSGMYGKGMTQFNARREQGRLAAERPDLDWTVEQDASFGPDRFSVVGRQQDVPRGTESVDAPESRKNRGGNSDDARVRDGDGRADQDAPARDGDGAGDAAADGRAGGRKGAQDAAEGAVVAGRREPAIRTETKPDEVGARAEPSMREEPSDVGGPDEPTLFGMSGAQLEAMQGGKLAGKEAFPGRSRTKDEIASARDRAEQRKRDEAARVDDAAAEDPRIARLRDAGVEPGILLNAAKEAKEGDDSLIRDLMRINDVKPSGGTELYGGIPLKPIVDAIEKAFGMAPDYAKQWAKNIGELFGKSSEKDAPMYKKMWHAGQALLRASEGELRNLGSLHGSKEGFGMLADMLFERAGRARAERPAFEPERRRIYNKRMAVLDDAANAMKGIDDAQIANQLDSGNLKHPAAKMIAAMLEEHGQYLKEHGALEGLVKDGYFPGMPDQVKILANESTFLRDAEQAMRMSGADDPKQAAADWLKAIKLGEAGVAKGAAEFAVPVTSGLPSNLKSRTLSKQARAMLRNKGWYQSSVYDVISSYLWRSTSAAEMLRTLGKDAEHWVAAKKKILEDGGEAGISSAVQIMSRVFGVRQPTPGAFSQATMAASKVLTPMMLLGRAAMTSIPELAMPAIRAGKPWLIPKAVKDGVKAMMKTADMEDKVQFARYMGALSSAMDAATQTARITGDYTPSGKKWDRLMSRYFTLTGLHPLTEATKTVAVDFGRAFIADHALHVTRGSTQAKTSRFFLSELVPESKVDAFAKWISDVEMGKVPLDKAMKNKEMAHAYERGLYKFLGESVMTPGRAERPTWASTPQGQILYELTSYTQAFFKNVMGRVGNLAVRAAKGDTSAAEKAMLMLPAVGVGMLMPMQYLQYEIRDMLFADKNRKEKTEWEKWMRAFSGSGYIGIWDRVFNAATGVRYGTDPLTTAAGPFYGTMARPLAAMAQKNSEKTNSTERAIVSSLYQTMIQPAIVLAATAAPGGPMATPLAALAIQAASAPATREAVTTAVAGEKKKRKPREDRVF